MDDTLLRFISVLRNHDLPVSTSESLDALRTAALLGYSERGLLKQGLAATLTKDGDSKRIFDSCFDQFFGVSDEHPDAPPQRDDLAHPPPDNFELSPELAADADVAAALQAPLVQVVTGDNPAAITIATQEAAQEINLEAIRFTTQKGLYRRRLMDQLGAEDLNRAIEALRAIEHEQADAAARWLEQRRHELDMISREMVEQQLLLGANAAGRAIQEQALRHTRLSALEQYHMKQLPPLVRKLAKKLATRHRRRRRVERRGRLDMGKTLRRNIAYGGVPFHTYWKKTRKDQPKLVVLCDVSGSVATYARFLLLFLYSLNEVMPKIRSFVFTHKMVEVTDIFDRQPPERAVEEVNQRWGLGSSDYGASFAEFGEHYLGQVDSNTTVIVLGDGRANGVHTGIDTLRDIYHRARLVLWFNPEPKTNWNTGDSEMRRYQSACHMVAECNSLAKLERLLDQLLNLIR